MTTCTHGSLELLPAAGERLRCKRCHLTIGVQELGGSCCPECLEETGVKVYEFEAVENLLPSAVRYRCESCGVIIESR